MVNENQVVEYSVTDAEIGRLQVQYADVPANLDDKQSYEYVRKAVGHLRTLRNDVERKRKELKADALAWGKKVDSEAKRITERIVEIEEPLATAKKDYDTAEEIRKREEALKEERRVDGILSRIIEIKALPAANISAKAGGVGSVIVYLDDMVAAEWAEEFLPKAEEAIAEAREKLLELLLMKRHQEESEARAAQEAEQRRIEEIARKKKEEEDAAAERTRMAEERAALEAERAKMAAEKAEQDRIAAADRARLEAEIAALKKQQEPPPPPKKEPVSEPAKTQPADGPSDEYKAAGNALLKLTASKFMAKSILDAIINGDIPNITYTGA